MGIKNAKLFFLNWVYFALTINDSLNFLDHGLYFFKLQMIFFHLFNLTLHSQELYLFLHLSNKLIINAVFKLWRSLSLSDLTIRMKL